MKKNKLQNGEKLEYPIKLYHLKGDIIITFLISITMILLSFTLYDDKRYFFSMLCIILGIPMLKASLKSLFNQQPWISIDAEKMSVRQLFAKKAEYFWKNVEIVELNDIVKDMGENGKIRIWSCIVALKDGNDQCVKLDKARFKKTVLNPKEVFSLIEQAQRGEKIVEYEKIIITKTEYHPPDDGMMHALMALAIVMIIMIIIAS